MALYVGGYISGSQIKDQLNRDAGLCHFHSTGQSTDQEMTQGMSLEGMCLVEGAGGRLEGRKRV